MPKPKPPFLPTSSLLEQVKARNPHPFRFKPMSEDELELYYALLKGEVRLIDVCEMMGLSRSGVSYRALRAFNRLCREGRLVLPPFKRKDA